MKFVNKIIKKNIMRKYMIKAVIFDFGGVLCDVNTNIFLQKISQYSNKTVDQLRSLIYSRCGPFIKYESGMITSDEFFQTLSGITNLSMSKSKFIEAYFNIFTPYQENFDLVRNLRRNYKLALLSDTNEWMFEYGFKPLGVLDLFDAITLSYQVKQMKPGKKIYFDALVKLDLEPEECVYIDDVEEFSKTANQIGMHGIHYTSHKQLIKTLKKFQVLF